MGKRTPVVDRLLRRVVWGDRFQGTRCLLWTGSLCQGYGTIGSDGKVVKTHRVMYERWFGPIPEGLVLDHLCRNRSCCNPLHLEPVTDAVNIARGLTGKVNHHQALKTHCVRGHLFDEENTYYRKDHPTHRMCRACRRERRRRGSAA